MFVKRPRLRLAFAKLVVTLQLAPTLFFCDRLMRRWHCRRQLFGSDYRSISTLFVCSPIVPVIEPHVPSRFIRRYPRQDLWTIKTHCAGPFAEPRSDDSGLLRECLPAIRDTMIIRKNPFTSCGKKRNLGPRQFDPIFLYSV